MPQPLGEPCPPASPCSGKECRSTSIKPIRWRPVTDALTIYEPSRSARLTEKGKSLSKTSKPAWPAPRPLFIDAERARLRRTDGSDLRAWDLDGRQLCLLELMLSGALTPHDRYIGAGDHAAVLEHASLADGTPCPWPLALEVTEAFANTVNVGETLALRDSEGLLVATLELEEIYAVDADAVAAALFPSGALFDAEPSAGRDWAQGQNTHRLAGRLIGIEPVFHYDFAGLRTPPSELLGRIQRRRWRKVLAIVTRRPLGPGEHAVVQRRARELEANVLLLPEAGMAAPGDARYYARLRALEIALPRFAEQSAEITIAPLPRPLGSPREIGLRHLVARNYGATHLLMLDTDGRPDGLEGVDVDLLQGLDAVIGIEAVAGGRPYHVAERGLFCLEDEAPEGANAQPCDSGELLERLAAGERIPDWLGWPEILPALRQAWPPRAAQGFTLFLTGLSGSGKSTIARALLGLLMEEGSRRVTLLDGDIVRKNLSSELGFSREHRDLNIRRIGFVASEITKNGGIAICAPIAPYAGTRRAVRSLIERGGGFVEVHVSTPLETCEARDRKGLYAKARAGLITEFTGISDPYEVPENPEIRIDTSEIAPDEGAQAIVLKLRALGYLSAESRG